MEMDVRRTIKFPAPCAMLFEPARYKVLHGGRGGGKSWAIARALLIEGRKRKIKVLCCREIQKAITDSVMALLNEQIEELDNAVTAEDPNNHGMFLGHYSVKKTTIVGANGTEFIFAGLKHNIDSIRSKEGIDIVWVEEANLVSADSWTKLTPTIRKDGSEIWVSFNPELEADNTYQRFVVDPPASAKVVEVNWRDNPWFPEALKADKDELRERNYEEYLWVWEGKCKRFLKGAIYADELMAAEAAGRITSVPYYSGAPVNTFWDLGWRDLLSIWFVQRVGVNYHVIDFWQGRKTALPKVVRMLQNEAHPYAYGTHHLPHDGAHETLAAGGVSIKSQLRKAMPAVKTVVQKRLSKTAGISAVRSVFEMCYFDAKKTADGLASLRRYRYEIGDNGEFSRVPLHDEASHPADAFRGFGISTTNWATVQDDDDPVPVGGDELYEAPSQQGWMGV